MEVEGTSREIHRRRDAMVLQRMWNVSPTAWMCSREGKYLRELAVPIPGTPGKYFLLNDATAFTGWSWDILFICIFIHFLYVDVLNVSNWSDWNGMTLIKSIAGIGSQFGSQTWTEMNQTCIVRLHCMHTYAVYCYRCSVVCLCLLSVGHNLELCHNRWTSWGLGCGLELA